MGNADRRIGGIHVLSTCTRGAIGIHAQIGGIDVNLDVVVDLWRYEDRGKGGVPPTTAVKRRLADQTVHTRLSAQPAKRILALKLNRGTLEPSNLARRGLYKGRFKALVLAPAKIHSQ